MIGLLQCVEVHGHLTLFLLWVYLRMPRKVVDKGHEVPTSALCCILIRSLYVWVDYLKWSFTKLQKSEHNSTWLHFPEFWHIYVTYSLMPQFDVELKSLASFNSSNSSKNIRASLLPHTMRNPLFDDFSDKDSVFRYSQDMQNVLDVQWPSPNSMWSIGWVESSSISMLLVFLGFHSSWNHYSSWLVIWFEAS